MTTIAVRRVSTTSTRGMAAARFAAFSWSFDKPARCAAVRWEKLGGASPLVFGRPVLVGGSL